MNQYNEISTFQYMGSKTRIISHICEPVIKNKSIKTVVDLFAGTGSVGYALKAHKNIISNDLECLLIFCNPALSRKSGAFTILIPPTPLMRPQSMAITDLLAIVLHRSLRRRKLLCAVFGGVHAVGDLDNR